MMRFSISSLRTGDIPGLAALMREDGRGREQALEYQAQHESGVRTVLVVRLADSLVGYVTLLAHSAYLSFEEEGIPEINDLYVSAAHRGRGLGSALIEVAEATAAQQGYSQVGLCARECGDRVALRMYQKIGYVWDGQESRLTRWGLLRYLTKKLSIADSAVSAWAGDASLSVAGVKSR